MTDDRHDHGSVRDLTLRLAQDRIADLRASAPSAVEPARAGHDGNATSGLVRRTRDAIGRRLIALGGSVVADEGLRQRALRL
ncbi:MAG: hypothetical protein QOD78_560 [Chloroflexota bacterium]|nr:hypothetical protein [Chloroflexota bacterium]